MRPPRRAVALVVALAAMPGAAPAAKHPSCPATPLGAEQVGAPADMTFTLRTVEGRRILVAEGGITAATPARLAAALSANAGIDEMWIRSAGGNAAAGNRTATLLRKSGLPVRIPRGWWCISACNFLFFGGALRSIDDGGQFGVHMATVVNDPGYQKAMLDKEQKVIAITRQRNGQAVADQAALYATTTNLSEIARREQSMALLTADDIDVILRMGVSRKLLSEVMYAQRADGFRDDDGDGRLDFDAAATFRCLTQAEMRRYNVVNID